MTPLLLLRYFSVFLFGLIVGSFLNVFIYRFPRSQGWFFGKSFCPFCRHPLAGRDLIPLLSFLLLKGRCRYCQKPISLQYPLVEFFTAVLLVLVFWHWDFGFDLTLGLGLWDLITLLYYWTIVSFLMIIFVYDLKYFIIPNKIIYPAITITFLYRLWEGFRFSLWDFELVWDLGLRILDFKPLLYATSSALLASSFFFSIFLISRGRWLGLGDVKLAFLMGLFLGFPNILVALFFAFSIGAIMGLGLMVLGKKGLKSEVAFAPFLVLGTLIALFWGEVTAHWYLNLLTL